MSDLPELSLQYDPDTLGVDEQGRLKVVGGGGASSFSELSGNPADNLALAAALEAKKPFVLVPDVTLDSNNYGSVAALISGAGITQGKTFSVPNDCADGGLGAIKAACLGTTATFAATDVYQKYSTWTIYVGQQGYQLNPSYAELAAGVQAAEAASAPIVHVARHKTGGDDALAATDIGAVPASSMGQANGGATLDINGKLAASQIPASLIGAMVFQTTWDCSGGAYPSANPIKGWYWIAGVAGTLPNGHNYKVNDWIVYDGNNSWVWVDNQTPVLSVNSKVGTVSLTQDDIPNGTIYKRATGTNTGDETASTIKAKLGITTLSGNNTGDQDVNGAIGNALSDYDDRLAMASGSFLLPIKGILTYAQITALTEHADGDRYWISDASGVIAQWYNGAWETFQVGLSYNNSSVMFVLFNTGDGKFYRFNLAGSIVAITDAAGSITLASLLSSAANGAIPWTKVSKTGATAADIGAQAKAWNAATFAAGSNTFTVTDASILATSKIALWPMGPKLGNWTGSASTGSFVVTSNTVETANVPFDWRIEN